MTKQKPTTFAFTGINIDQLDGIVEHDWWTGGRNVFFKAGATCRVPGEGVFAPGGLFAAQFCHYVDVGVSSYWIYGGDAGVAVTNGVTHWNVTPAGWGPIAAANLKYSVGDLSGVAFVNHPERKAYWWDADVSHVMTVLPDWPANWHAGVMRAHKNFLMAGNIDTGAGLAEAQVSWSSSADPGLVPQFWVPSPTNDAGDFTFGTPSGPIVDMLSVRDQLLVAKSNFTGVLQYVGGQFVFEGRDLFPSTGLFAQGAWTEAVNMVYMITGRGKFIKTDTTSVIDLLYGILEEYFQKQVNWQFPSSVFAWRDAQNGQICFGYPVGGAGQKACNEAITIEVATDRPGIRDLSNVYHASMGITTIESQAWDDDTATWDSDVTTWNETASGYRPEQVVFAAGATGLLQQGKTNDFVGGPIAASATRESIDLFGDLDRNTLVSGLKPRVKGNTGSTLNFTMTGQRFDGDAFVPSDPPGPLPFAIAAQEQIDLFLDAKLFSVAVSSTGGAPWQLSQTHMMTRGSGRW